MKRFIMSLPVHTEVRFANFLSGGFTTMAVMNPPEKKLKKRTSVQCNEFKGFIKWYKVSFSFTIAILFFLKKSKLSCLQFFQKNSILVLNF